MVLVAAGIAGLALCQGQSTVMAQANVGKMPGQPPSSSIDTSVAKNGSIRIPSITIPFSNFASQEALQAFIRKSSKPAPALGEDILAQRASADKGNDALARRMKTIYAVNISSENIGGVRTEVVTPKEGVSPRNRRRVLINLHGGAFLWGEGSGGEIESIPIASVGKITVITVAYREGPENEFPAASEDVAAVYRALLRKYKPGNIGIYGCSAGGILTAESVAWFEHVKLPIPGAIGTFCGSIDKPNGDSAYLGRILTGESLTDVNAPLSSLPYFRNAKMDDPLVFPINSPEILAKFPPTLLIAGSRDFMASSLYHAQSALTRQGVETELHIWDGMWHAFFIDPGLPESREVYDVIVRFFDRHLGTK